MNFKGVSEGFRSYYKASQTSMRDLGEFQENFRCVSGHYSMDENVMKSHVKHVMTFFILFSICIINIFVFLFIREF